MTMAHLLVSEVLRTNELRVWFLSEHLADVQNSCGQTVQHLKEPKEARQSACQIAQRPEGDSHIRIPIAFRTKPSKSTSGRSSSHLFEKPNLISV